MYELRNRQYPAEMPAEQSSTDKCRTSLIGVRKLRSVVTFYGDKMLN